jgi:hypothetical protein
LVQLSDEPIADRYRSPTAFLDVEELAKRHLNGDSELQFELCLSEQPTEINPRFKSSKLRDIQSPISNREVSIRAFEGVKQITGRNKRRVAPRICVGVVVM